MKPRPLLLDLYCGAGGAAAGYYRAGFDVLGVDIEPQDRYPFPFVQANALEFLSTCSPEIFDAAHASPPCQLWTTGRATRDRWADLLTPTRDLLERSGLPWVIENVPGSPMRADLKLCGSSFGLEAGGFELRRHRWFESNRTLGLAPPCMHSRPSIPVFGHGPNADFYARHGRGFSALLRAEAMGISWMNRDELSEAIPPAFTAYVGGLLLEAVEREAVA